MVTDSFRTVLNVVSLIAETAAPVSNSIFSCRPLTVTGIVIGSDLELIENILYDAGESVVVDDGYDGTDVLEIVATSSVLVLLNLGLFPGR